MNRSAIAAILLSLAALGCSEDEPTQPPPPPSGHTITVSPNSASVWVHMSQGFVATPSDTADHDVTWRLRRDPSLSDTLDVGTIVTTGPKSVTYTAPAKVEDALFGYSLTLQAVSTRDTTVRGVTQIIVPPVKVAILPDAAVNVLPAAELPFTILVGNTPNKGFTLEVNDIPGGNVGVGTFVMTGPASATYTAPVKDSAEVYTLRARSTDDSRRSGIARLSVFPGFVLPTTDPTQNQWTPEWSITAPPRLAYVRGGGGSWQLVIYDFDTHSEQVLTTLAWSGPTYDGRIAWSDTGGRLLFSEETSGRRTIGVIQENGTGRTTFAPQAFTDYEEACFVPGSFDSIYVTQRNGVNWSLRAYRLGGLPGDVGRTLHAPAPAVELHSPDATLRSGSLRPYVAFETVVNGHGTVRSMNDDGAGRVGVAYSSATGRTRQVRWAHPANSPIFANEWITFVHQQNNALYRVDPSGLNLPILCYTEYFPEASSDLKVLPLPTNYFGFDDPLAITRLDASGHWRIWVVEFPPSLIVMRPRGAGLARILGVR